MKLSEKNQSQTNRTFQNKNHVNKFNTSENTTTGRSDINTVKSSLNERKRENRYHWGASREIMEITRKRNKIPEIRRLVERREMLARPGTMRRSTTHNLKGQYSHRLDQIKEGKKLPKLMRNSHTVLTG